MRAARQHPSQPGRRSLAGETARPRRGGLLAVLAVVCAAGAVGALVLAGGSPAAVAHGSVSNPPSRTYLCRFLQPDSPMCAQAWQANAQALYDWMEVNIADAAGRHQQLIPDGQLCSAGRAKYAAFDRPSASWPTTPITRDAAGRTHLEYEATAPHATLYFRWYLTRAGYDPAQPLRWADLELVHDSGPQPAQAHYHADVALPARSGHHILYQVWQRSDSPEAFYACSDVSFGASGPSTTTSVPPSTTVPPTTVPSTTVPSTTVPSTTVPSTTVPPTTSSTAPGTGQRVAVRLATTTDWGSGHCAQATVTNVTDQPLRWSVTVSLGGRFTSLWDAVANRSSGTVTVRGANWNSTLAAHASTTFGYCATGSPGTAR